MHMQMNQIFMSFTAGDLIYARSSCPHLVSMSLYMLVMCPTSTQLKHQSKQTCKLNSVEFTMSGCLLWKIKCSCTLSTQWLFLNVPCGSFAYLHENVGRCFCCCVRDSSQTPRYSVIQKEDEKTSCAITWQAIPKLIMGWILEPGSRTESVYCLLRSREQSLVVIQVRL